MKPYPREFRLAVLVACDAGLSTRVVAKQFRVSESWVRRVKQDRRERQKLEPSRTRRRTPRWAAVADRLRDVLAERPEVTLRELKSILQTDLSLQTLATAVKRIRAPQGQGAIASGR